MDLSIIIVNWNSEPYLRKCVESIYANTKELDFEIIVVDNASYDGSAEMLGDNFPGVKFIQSTKNLGFSRANNLGFTQSIGKNLLFLNPDTEVIGPAINILLSHLLSIPVAGAVGGKLLNSDGSVQTSCIQRFPTILNQMLGTDYLILRFPTWKIWGVRPLFFHNGKPETVEIISGACLMIRRNLFETIGMFSTDYFMYGEDLDLCYKILLTGLKAYYVPEATVIHHGSTSADKVKSRHINTVLKRESVRTFFRKHKGECTAFLYTISTTFVAIIRLLLLLSLIPFSLLVQRKRLAPEIFRKWVEVLKWSLGLRRWARDLTRQNLVSQVSMEDNIK